MRNILYFSLITLFLTACTSNNEEELYPALCETEDLTYANEMSEIIANSCAVSGCHVAGNGRSVYDSYSNFSIDINNGTVLAKVITGKTMPPAGLTDCDFEKFEKWLSEGAKE